MSADPTTQSGHSREEEEEIAKHVALYQLDQSESLRMAPSDWEKFQFAEPLDSYTASMLRIGDVRGLKVLDAGCGDGWLSVILAKLGASVVAFDISPEGVNVARARATLNDVSEMVDLHTASFYSMPFPDGSFDIVIGQAILHHLRDKRAAALELRRVLKAGGRAIFVECFGNSMLMEKFRLLVPVPSSAPEDPDHWKDKVSYEDIATLREYFDVRIEEYHLLSRLDRIVGSRGIVRGLNRIDRMLLRNIPFLRRYARTILIELC